MQEADGDDRAADTSTSGRLGGSGGGGFRCDLCAMQCNSYQAYENHLLSKKHAVGWGGVWLPYGRVCFRGTRALIRPMGWLTFEFQI